jgi:hypothetical protein
MALPRRFMNRAQMLEITFEMFHALVVRTAEDQICTG